MHAAIADITAVVISNDPSAAKAAAEYMTVAAMAWQRKADEVGISGHCMEGYMQSHYT